MAYDAMPKSDDTTREFRGDRHNTKSKEDKDVFLRFGYATMISAKYNNYKAKSGGHCWLLISAECAAKASGYHCRQGIRSTGDWK